NHHSYFSSILPAPEVFTLFPYTTLFRSNAVKVLKRAVELGVNLIDTADAYGPEVDELLIAEALHPYPKGLVIATKGGNTRPGPEIGRDTSELQSPCNLVCRLLLEKKKQE